MSRKSRGFSLLELLVIFGIIVILSTIVLVNISQSRGKASDVVVTKNLSDLQTYANLYYLEKSGNYDGFCGADQSQIFLSNAGKENNRTCVQAIDGSAWCAYAELKTNSGLYYCVDSQIRKGRFSGSLVINSCSDTGGYSCPN